MFVVSFFDVIMNHVNCIYLNVNSLNCLNYKRKSYLDNLECSF